MSGCVSSYTAPGEFPAFVNITVLESGEVAITMRPAGEDMDESRQCGVTCYPSSDTCSGFCRGTAVKPQRHKHVKPGLTQRVVMSASQWEDFRAQIVASMGSVG
jgi:hypothetical protein